ncbi:MAG: hypothetical protein RML35_00780 [Chloroherpetonaceae bacterium]|nr:hypothetical protein [Chloroherpetonaceae bacterium]
MNRCFFEENRRHKLASRKENDTIWGEKVEEDMVRTESISTIRGIASSAIKRTGRVLGHVAKAAGSVRKGFMKGLKDSEDNAEEENGEWIGEKDKRSSYSGDDYLFRVPISGKDDYQSSVKKKRLSDKQKELKRSALDYFKEKPSRFVSKLGEAGREIASLISLRDPVRMVSGFAKGGESMIDAIF